MIPDEKLVNSDEETQNKAINKASAGLNSDRPYQLNQGSLQEVEPVPKDLKGSIIYFTVIYSIIFVLFLISLWFSLKHFDFDLATNTYPASVWMGLMLLASIPISFISYYLGQKKMPIEEAFVRQRRHFKIYVIVAYFVLPFAIPFVLYGLWILGPMFL